MNTNQAAGVEDRVMTDDDIERVARGICRNLGLDPDEEVSFGVGDTMTPAERNENLGGFVPDIALFGPRWRLYRETAAMAIATRAAISDDS